MRWSVRTRVGLLLAVAAVVGSWGWSSAFISGDGKGPSSNDCLVGIDGEGGGAVGILKGKLAVQCTDCDPACDADGGRSPNGACTFPIAACVNSPDVAGCAPAALATAVVKPKNLGVSPPSPLPIDTRFACGSPGAVVVATKKNGTKPGKKLIRLTAKSSGSPKRKDADAFVLVCNPRPAGTACPAPQTTTSTLAAQTTTTVFGATTSSTLPGNTTTSTPSSTSSSSTSTSTSTTVSTTIPGCSPNCPIGTTCSSGNECSSNLCVGVCRCQTFGFTFKVDSNVGGSADPAEWPGGSDVEETTPGCYVVVNRPADDVDVVGGLASGFSIDSFTGFSSCSLDSCAVNACPPGGVGSCSGNRPSCSAALNGSGQAQIVVTCNQ